MTMRHLTLIRTLMGTAVLVGCAGTAFSQTSARQDEPASTASASGSGLSEIIVTARRREERLQNVPISATAFDANSLTQRNISNTQDLLGQVPSLVVGGSGQQRNTENITIRGQGATFNAAPGVVLYSAEVPLIADQRNNAQNGGGFNYYDLASLQVLRGPQGTLFGRNTTGGAVLFEPQRPTDRLEGYGQIQYGNYDSVEVRGALNLPIVEDTLLLRVAGIYQKRDGFTHEITTDTDLDNRNRYSFRAGLTWRMAPGIENYLLATVGRVQEHGTGTVLNAVPGGVDPQTGLPFSTYLQQQIGRGIRSVALSPLLWSERTRYFSITDIFSAELTDTLTFRNIANYQHLKNSAPFDGDGYPDDHRPPSTQGGTLIGGDEIDPGRLPSYNYYTDARQYSFEPQFQGKLAGEALNFTVGAYYESVKPLGAQLVSAFNPTRRGQRTISQALYAQGTLSFGSLSESLDGLRLTAGYRYTWDKLTAFSNFGLPDAPVTRSSAKFKAPNWTVGLDYNVNQNVLLYAKVSRGYKTGGVGTSTPAPDLRSFQPEFVTAYEGGIKADWHVGSIPIRTNINYYYTSYKDLQRTGGTAYFYNGQQVFGAQTSNAGKAHIQGVEFEGEVRPTRWLTLSGTYSHTAAKYDEYTAPSLFPAGIPAFGLPPGFDCGVGVPFNGATGQCVLTNIPFQFTPKNQFSITGRVDLPLDESIGKVSISATYSYIDAQYTSPSKAPIDEPFAYIGGNCPRVNSGTYAGSVRCGPGDGYGLLGLNIQWQNVAGSNFDLGAFATNLTNEKYIISSQGVSYQNGFNSYIYGEPRMYGMSLRYHFGT